MNPSNDKQNTSGQTVAGTVIMIALLIGCFIWIQDNKNAQADKDKDIDQHPLIGQTFPDFEIEADTGEIVNFASGKPMAVMLFSSWCPHCNTGIDAYTAFAKARNDINVVLINTQVFENSYIDEKRIVFPVIYDEKGVYTDELNINSTLVNVILDERGVITDVINGDIPIENLKMIFPKRFGSNNAQ